jgi:RNA polymerase sigma-70 factor (ECF subfamily)
MSECENNRATDGVLIRYSLDEPEMFAKIYERHAPSIHRYLSKRVESSRVEDLASETFVTAFRNRRQYDFSYPNARPWLFGIAANILRHHRRAEIRRLNTLRAVRPNVVEADASDQIIAKLSFGVEEQKIKFALEQLDESYCEVLMLLTGPALSYEEISRAIGIPIGTVRSRISRGRAQLRKLLRMTEQYSDLEDLRKGAC